MPPPSQTNCHSCQQPIRPGSKFCPLCGAAQESTIPCPACHAPVVEGRAFCPQCGATLAGESGEAEGSTDGDDLTRLFIPGDGDEVIDQSDADFPDARDRRPDDLLDGWEEPVTEMFLESNWQPEGGLSDLARQIDADTNPTLPAGEAAAPPDPAPPPSPSPTSPARDDQPFPDSVPIQPTSDKDLERTVIMRSGFGLPPEAPAGEAPLPESDDQSTGSAEWGAETVRYSAEALQQERDALAPAPASPGPPRRLAMLAVIVVVALAGLLYWWYAGDDGTPPSAAPDATATGGDTTPAIAQPEPPAAPAAAPADEPVQPPALQADTPAIPADVTAPGGIVAPQIADGDPLPPADATDLGEPAGDDGSETADDIAAPIAEPEPAPAAAPEPAPAPKPRPRPKPRPKPIAKPAPVPTPPPPPPTEPLPATEPVPPPPALPAWQRQLREELAVCDRKSFFTKAICREKVRWQYCAPDRWDTVPECEVSGQ
ncbi:MAG: zinc ribbon domain-containing protein [Rhodocyclaceae bacterium]|nr:zinc ribbon domain-containing protein [Rhodocyclaceae bacterium]